MAGIGTGLWTGLLIAAPVGPIGLLCIRRTLAQGRIAGFVSGLGVATADTIFAAIAALGVGTIDAALTAHEQVIKAIGGAIIIYLGIKMALLHPPDPKVAQEVPRNLVGDYFSICGLTLANPQTIVSFAALFGTAAHMAHPSARSVSELLVGVFVGSAAWWAFLAGLTGYLRTAVTAKTLHKICVGAGLVVVGFGMWLIASIFLAPALP